MQYMFLICSSAGCNKYITRWSRTVELCCIGIERCCVVCVCVWMSVNCGTVLHWHWTMLCCVCVCECLWTVELCCRSDHLKHCRSPIRSTSSREEALSCWFFARSSHLTRRSSTFSTRLTALKPVLWTLTSCGWLSRELGCLMHIWSLCGHLPLIYMPTRRRWSCCSSSRCSRPIAAVLSVSRWLLHTSRSTACCCSATSSRGTRLPSLGHCFLACSWRWPTYETSTKSTHTFCWRWILKVSSLSWRKYLI